MPEQPRLVFRAALLVAEARLRCRLTAANDLGSAPGAAQVHSWLTELWPERVRRGRSSVFLRRVAGGAARRLY
jgi:hypothetical protein